MVAALRPGSREEAHLRQIFSESRVWISLRSDEEHLKQLGEIISAEEDTVLEADLRKGTQTVKSSAAGCGRAGQPNAEQQLSDRQTLLEIDNLFKDDQKRRWC